jgi:hypothetical protein
VRILFCGDCFPASRSLRAGVTEESYGQIADAVAANVQRLGQGLPILNRVI